MAMEPQQKTDEKSGGVKADDLEKIITRVMQGVQPSLRLDDIQKIIEKTAKESFNPGAVEQKIQGVVNGIEQRAMCARLLDKRLSESGLPEVTQKKLSVAFEGKTFKPEDLESLIKEEKEYLAKLEVPVFSVGDQSRAEVGIGAKEKISMAIDKMFGLSKEDAVLSARMSVNLQTHEEFCRRAVKDIESHYDEIAPFSGLKALYVRMTGDEYVSGRMNKGRVASEFRALQDLTTGTFSYLLGDTLNRRLVKEYSATDYQENLLISARKSVSDYRSQEAVMTGYFSDIPEVNTEAEDYGEVGVISDEKAEYTLSKRGVILSISDKVIINDDLGFVQSAVRKLGQAARRTHAKYVWDFFVSNRNCSDGTPWFTSGHGNLITTGLTTIPAGIAAVLTLYKALLKATEKDSGEPIGIVDMMTLVYPVDLIDIAEGVVNDTEYYTSNDLTTKRRNPLKGKIEGVQCPLLTDTNDWGLLRNPFMWEMIEMGYLYGRQEPEFILADNPQNSESMFTADKIRYKLRHIYNGALVDHRSGGKGVV